MRTLSKPPSFNGKFVVQPDLETFLINRGLPIHPEPIQPGPVESLAFPELSPPGPSPVAAEVPVVGLVPCRVVDPPTPPARRTNPLLEWTARHQAEAEDCDDPARLVLRCRRGYKDWVEALAEHTGLSVTVLVTTALAQWGANAGFGSPPKRYSRHRIDPASRDL